MEYNAGLMEAQQQFAAARWEKHEGRRARRPRAL
jgi:hypothetical protein